MHKYQVWICCMCLDGERIVPIPESFKSMGHVGAKSHPDALHILGLRRSARVARSFYLLKRAGESWDEIRNQFGIHTNLLGYVVGWAPLEFLSRENSIPLGASMLKAYPTEPYPSREQRAKV